MIPNACSAINLGYNPILFSTEIDKKEKKDILEILSVPGKCPEVCEGVRGLCHSNCNGSHLSMVSAL